jgi:hypothetical protein
MAILAQKLDLLDYNSMWLIEEGTHNFYIRNRKVSQARTIRGRKQANNKDKTSSILIFVPPVNLVV